MNLKLDVRIGSQRPTTVNLPSDRHGSTGPEAVDLAALAGLFLDDWQQWCLEEALREASDGQWSAFEVAVLVGRQNGKGSILEARQLAGLFLLHERLQVHTAHEFKTCFEHFLRVVNLIEATPELDRQVMRIRRGAGEQAVELMTGERLRFLARSGGSGRGMSGDAVYLDEAFALTPSMMGALLPTLSARPNPQIWYMSSAPMSTSTVLHGVRRRGHAEKSPRLFFAEWGHDADVDPNDRDAWYRANPALGIRIFEDFIEAELDAMSSMTGEFARERLGVPDASLAELESTLVVDPAAWLAVTDPASVAIDPVVFGVDASLDRQWSSIVVAANRSEGGQHIEVIDRRPGVPWLVSRLLELRQTWPRSEIVIDPTSAAWSIVVELNAAGVEVSKCTPQSVAAACGAFVDAVAGKTLHYRPDPEHMAAMSAAVFAARKRAVGDGWAWSRKDSQSDITPLVAATLALGKLPAARESAYSEERGLTVVG